MNAKQVKGITVGKIAELTGQSEVTVRRHIGDGVLDFDDCLDVMEYVIGYRLAVKDRCKNGKV